MSQIVATKASQGSRLYSLGDAARHLQAGLTAVKGYKKILARAWELDLYVVIEPGSKKLTEQGLREMKLIKEFCSRQNSEGYVKALWQSNPHLEDRGHPDHPNHPDQGTPTRQPDQVEESDSVVQSSQEQLAPAAQPSQAENLVIDVEILAATPAREIKIELPKNLSIDIASGGIEQEFICDPLTLAQQTMSALDILSAGVNAKLSENRQSLINTEVAADALAKKVQETEQLLRDISEENQRILAKAQIANNQIIQDASRLGKLQSVTQPKSGE